jgi:3,4-dihydroxy 2-butanone 4-phosphate synthase/GTP cyclohydrolase II
VNDIHKRVETVLAAFAKGEIVVVTDDDDRENEGDLFVAASLCTPEKMAFIIRNTSGIVCAPLAPEEAKRLHLDPMVALNDAPLGTAFTVSVDAPRPPLASRRRSAAAPCARSPAAQRRQRFRPPGPRVSTGRQGRWRAHALATEACIDLPARRAAAGRRACGTDERRRHRDARGRRVGFAERHKLKQISIADLIAYRQARDKLVKRVGEFPVKSEIGTLGLRLCHPVRRGPAHGLRVRPHRRRQGRACALASRRHHS